MSYSSDIQAAAIALDGVPDSNTTARREPLVAGLISRYRPRAGSLLTLGGYLLLMTLVYLGWSQRAERVLTAESGPGYTLGIIGGVMMLLLLLYPLRKHCRAMRRLGPVKYWFRAHMLFGLLGPVCILFHSGFRLGSLNSNIALFCMLTVAGSGLVGRYFYTRIHHGLYGRKASLEELSRHAALLGHKLASSLDHYPWAADRIEAFRQRTLQAPHSVAGSLLMLLSLGLRSRALYLWLWLRMPAELSRARRRALLRHMGAQLESLRRVAEFHFYERLFAAWHVLHLPLFLMLIVSGTVHVIAVHLY